jgi:hypothetical protein
MKDDAVIETLTRQGLDALDMAGRKIGPERDHDAALGGFEDERILRVRCHL